LSLWLIEQTTPDSCATPHGNPSNSCATPHICGSNSGAASDTDSYSCAASHTGTRQSFDRHFGNGQSATARQSITDGHVNGRSDRRDWMGHCGFLVGLAVPCAFVNRAVTASIRATRAVPLLPPKQAALPWRTPWLMMAALVGR